MGLQVHFIALDSARANCCISPNKPLGANKPLTLISPAPQVAGRNKPRVANKLRRGCCVNETMHALSQNPGNRRIYTWRRNAQGIEISQRKKVRHFTITISEKLEVAKEAKLVGNRAAA